MSRYSIAVKRGDAQYCVSSDSKEFLVSHINKVFAELKERPESLYDNNFAKLNIEKSEPSEVNLTDKPEPVLENEPQATLQEPDIQTDFAEPEGFTAHAESIEPAEATEADETVETAENEKLAQPQAETVETDSNSNETGEFSFENILEEKLQNPVYEEDKPVESSFDYESIIKMKQPESLVDYLIITAYYMLENEGRDTFELKQLNAKLFKSMKMVVDRKTMQKAVDDGLVGVISDGLDNNGIVEYSLTPRGREFYINGCA